MKIKSRLLNELMKVWYLHRKLCIYIESRYFMQVYELLCITMNNEMNNEISCI